ncbi:hypothetical protein [Nocardia implantans]|uniref:Lipoprotein n=1 Tax=Nocardia implantans TaxID=3108168 RepID=A0ABU6AT98_9NOCA|nr:MULTISPECIES: hypothetical protein [unclassified Nocardia]MBF6191032.1 hypothetical protein [Nocardia beijingensis]MEA3529027.1 hypothetical protein [Nocardia sp. CDC192]MEB3510692.1 hypothetical protein [Nocardia sp. CDC186]
MASRRVSYTVPALVAMALVSSGCGAGGTAAPRPIVTTVFTTTSKPPTRTTPPMTTTAPPTTTTPRITSTAPTTDTAQPIYVGICVDQTTSTRATDDLCDTTDSRYATFWYRHADALVYPAVGAAVALAAGTFLRPSGTAVHDRGVPATGGTIQRGVLGQGRPDIGGVGS